MTSLSFKDFQNAQTALANEAPATPFSAAGDVLAARWNAGISTGSTGRNINSLDASRRFYAEMEARGVPAAQWAEEARFSEAERRGSKGAGNYQPSEAPTDIYNTEISDLVWQRYVRENPPAAAHSLGPKPSAVADEIGRTAEEVAQELTSRAGTLGAAAGFVGDLGAAIISPETLATALFTPVRVAAVGWSAVSRVAGREAAFGAGFEVPAQAAIQSYKQDIGLPHGGFWESATNVAVVGGLSGVLGGMIRGVVEWRNSVRAGRTVPGSAARRYFNDLSPAAKRELEDVSSDAVAVEAIVSRQFETNPRFRKRLSPAEHASIERAIQFRQNLQPFAPRTPAEANAVARVLDNVGAAVEAGLPLRAGDIPDDPVIASLLAADQASRQRMRAALATGDTQVEGSGAPTRETLEDIRRLFPEAAEEVEAVVRARPSPEVAAQTSPDSTVVAPADPAGQPEFRFARGQERELDALLKATGRSRQDVQAAIDAGIAPTGARGQITRKTIEALDTAFDLLPETLRPRVGPVPDAPRNVAEMQDRSTALVGEEATSARLGADEVKVMKAQTEEARGEAAEATLKARLGDEAPQSTRSTDPAQASAREALEAVDLLRAQEDAIEVCRNG
jgi:hypothetical protein